VIKSAEKSGEPQQQPPPKTHDFILILFLGFSKLW